ncbi:nucleoside triphosphate pyrophosphohydrolase family protein [Luteipulveratus halotolerans]|uniref:Phosphoribosyl-ATP pyrophosphohydrolase n=1 Tax=Luteipulveratus halotolerans TaxID=1631356 RepID=A0A0L6CLK8_9MICO|nr:phosphoribosyl-ATP pyrophosphohydrolase [Luteipulveratus halotolerans]KNX38515.1 phosphoribosyl-ATP pyrophosphohydrolase [Luteipulveratus halotolerans]
MDIAELTDRVEYVSAGYADHYAVERTDEWILLKLTEEVGELVQAHLTASGQGRDRGLSQAEQDARTASELADVIGMCLVFARSRGIDVSQAMHDKWLQYEDFHRGRGFSTDVGSPA